MTQYPEDEFDVAARNRGPKGVHREIESPFRRLVPYLVILAAAPLLAWGLVSLLNQDGGDPAPVASPTSTVTPGATATAGGTTAPATTAPATTAPATTAPATPTTEPASDVDLAAPVVVLNGARVAGIAARTADRLTTAGFTAVTTGNYTATQPTATTVYYNNAALAPTAQAIGTELGIDQLVELASATDSIAVVLRTDFEE